MKTIVPPLLLQLVRQYQGLPVPVINHLRDGKPMFAYNDEGKRIHCLNKRLCTACSMLDGMEGHRAL